MKRIFYLSALCSLLLSGACSDENEVRHGMLENPYTTLSAEAKGYPACIAVSYRIAADAVSAGYLYGVCWNTEGNPTIQDNCHYGPQKPANGEPMTQYLPNTHFEYGKTYHFRTFVVADSQVWYSEDTAAALDGESLAPIALEWTKQNFAGLPEGIEVYKTTSDLNGRKFQAWYAIADCSGDGIELRVQNPRRSSGVTVDGQFTDDCYVLVNGGYFNFSDRSKPDGIEVIDGASYGEMYNPRGSWNAGDEEYDRYY